MKILLVEDNPDHQELMGFALKEHDPTWVIETARSRAELINRIDNLSEYGLIMLDYSLPGEDGLGLFYEIRQSQNPPPIIMVTGRGDEETAVSVMKAGAYDYVVKGNDYLTRLPVMAQRALETHRLEKEHQRAEQALKESELRFRSIFDQTFQFTGTVTLDGIITSANQRALAFIGAEESEIVGKPFWDTPWWEHSEETKLWLRKAIAQAAQGQAIQKEVTHISKNGNLHYFDFSIKPVVDENGKPLYLIPESRDITERKQALQNLETLNNELEERVLERTRDLETLVSAMAGREVRMAELKKVIKKLRQQLLDAGIDPVADDPLNSPNYFFDNEN